MERMLIGEGAFAKVYALTRPDTGQIYACKVSRKRQMLKKEATILAQLEHPLFPQFYDYREEGEEGFLSMEYIEGQTLSQRVTKQGNFTQREAIEIATQLAEGLLYLHERNPCILFRDLKPENIMLEEGGGVKLLDFGSADVGGMSLDVITGTKGYGAPEQWWDRSRVGKYSDVYALGKVIYFMLGNGKVDKWLEDLLENCITVNMQERLPDMRCFLAGLRSKKRGKNQFFYQKHIIK